GGGNPGGSPPGGRPPPRGCKLGGPRPPPPHPPPGRGRSSRLPPGGRLLYVAWAAGLREPGLKFRCEHLFQDRPGVLP
ncbi:hypothetical protein EJ800_22275, partial [Pseudomonas aeruginosa]